MFSRLGQLFEEGDGTREHMLDLAIGYFLENPLVGIGFDQFRVVSVYKAYSHSTYAEILACTGIIGTIIYFSIYISIISKLIKILVIRKNDLSDQRAKLMLVAMVVMIFQGIGVIHYYDLDSTIMFGIMVAFCNQALKVKADKENIDESIITRGN